MSVDSFLDLYVRIDEGTRVLLCVERSSVQTAAHLYAGIFVRGTKPSVIEFEQEDLATEATIREALVALRTPSTRRVAVIVCETGIPSFVEVLENNAERNRMAVFRISGLARAKSLL